MARPTSSETERRPAAGSDQPRTRLFVDVPLLAGQPVGLDHERAHFLRHVLRLDKGDCVALFNGRDGEWLASIDAFGKGWCSLSLTGQRRPQEGGPDLWLVFAPIKGGRIDSIAEKATELGVSRLLPVFTRHTNASRVNTDRLRANAVEAAEQCERLSIPEVTEPETLEKLLASWPADRTLYLCAESGMARSMADAVTGTHSGEAADGDAKTAAAAFLIGPEGGFEKAELDAISKLPFVVPVGLGPRILRADTAVVAALSCWQAIAGDWRHHDHDQRPPFRSPDGDQPV